MSVKTGIAPWLSVGDASKVIAFYKAAFGARELDRLDDEQGRPIIAHLAIDEAEFWVQEDPESRPGTVISVRMILTVDDPDAVYAQAIASGATELVPVNDAHGWRIGRMIDPAGHHWEIGKPL